MYRSVQLALNDDRDLYLVPKDRQVIVDDACWVSATGYIPVNYKGDKLPGHSHGVFSATALQLMVNNIKNRLPVSEAEKSGRRIYIRRNATIRKLLNCHEIEQQLLLAGFELVEPERLTFDEQVRLYRSADVIVGATGAGMANLIFAHANCKIFILIAHHPDMPYYYWQRMADCVGQRVSYLVGEQVSKLDLGIHADFMVSEAQIHRLLAAIDQDAR